MKTMSVRDVRQRWPEAERALAHCDEIVVTRDSKPVARIVPFKASAEKDRRRFDAKEHLQWMQAFWKGRRLPRIDGELTRDRRDRV